MAKYQTRSETGRFKMLWTYCHRLHDSTASDDTIVTQVAGHSRSHYVYADVRSFGRLAVFAVAGCLLAGCGNDASDAVLISRHCWVDTINSVLTDDITVERGSVKFTGWAADSSSGSTPEKAYLQLLNSRGNLVSTHFIAKRYERPDVVEVNKQPGYSKSGFEISIDLANTQPGTYGVSIAMKRDGASLVCESSKKITLK